MMAVTEVGRICATAGDGRYIIEYSPVGCTAINGLAERAVRSIQTTSTRTIVDGGERRPPAHNRFEVVHDCKKGYERCKGKTAKTLGIEFGETVLRKKTVGGALAKMTRLEEGGGLPQGEGCFRGGRRSRRKRGLEDALGAEEASGGQVERWCSGHGQARVVESPKHCTGRVPRSKISLRSVFLNGVMLSEKCRGRTRLAAYSEAASRHGAHLPDFFTPQTQ